MAINKVTWEESSEIVLDTTTEAAAVGWTLNHVSVNRIGNLVAVHIEAAFLAAAAALVCTLPSEFRPGETITTPDGRFTIAANGQVSFTGSTAAPGSGICQAVYQAGSVSP